MPATAQNMRQYLTGLTANLAKHTITDVQHDDRVSLLLKDSFIESFAPKERPFVRQFVVRCLFLLSSVHAVFTLCCVVLHKLHTGNWQPPAAACLVCCSLIYTRHTTDADMCLLRLLQETQMFTEFVVRLSGLQLVRIPVNIHSCQFTFLLQNALVTRLLRAHWI